ncbi:MAG: DUF1868 domain-containing protein [Oscillatoriales cyanobacterium C42_A2020_001]|nr:DUF1868 domain-containing protein [Leptolyngbyaceae cyanobacterium C42_A2020_001]
MDENFQTYLNRAMRMTLPETYRSQVQHIQESPKYELHPGKGLEALPFPGYTIITPPGGEDDAENQGLFTFLEGFQQQLVQHLGSEVFAPVPSSSFHITLADLIWNGSFRHATEDASFEVQLRDRIQQIFQECEPLSEGKPIRFQALGLMVMTRALAICLAPVEEYSYERILKFRRAIYQNRGLIGLGIEQQYYFTPHITLGYFGTAPSTEQRPQLGEIFVNLNQQWLDREPQMYSVSRAELRKFDDMTRYYREPDWAVFKF